MNTSSTNKGCVIQTCMSRAWGGLEMSSVKMTRLFHEHGYRSINLCPPNSAIEKECHTLGLETRAWEGRDYFDWGARRELKQAIEELRPRAIYTHRMKDIWHISPVLQKYPNVRLYSFARMFFRNVNKKDFLHRRIYGRLNGLITLSSAQKAAFLDCLPLPDRKYVTIPNGVDVERFSPGPASQEVRRELGATTADQVLVGLIGRLDRQKGSLEFVEASLTLAERYPQAKFVLVGGETEYEPGLQAEVEQLLAKSPAQRDRVLLTGFRKDIPEVMRALDIFVMPSYEENFANVMLEAMASGRACVGTRSGGTVDMIEDGVNGVLVDPKSSNSLAAGLEPLIQSKELRNRLGAAARTKAETQYALENVFSRISTLIELPA